jgi:hypothetical protein
MAPTTRSSSAKKTSQPPPNDADAFWLFYLRQHSHPLTRAVHYCGTVAALLIAAGLLPSPFDHLGGGGAERGAKAFASRAAGTLLVGYFPSWLSHFLVEGNRPATWVAPLRSLRGDLRMLGCFLTGGLSRELRRAGVEN